MIQTKALESWHGALIAKKCNFQLCNFFGQDDQIFQWCDMFEEKGNWSVVNVVISTIFSSHYYRNVLLVYNMNSVPKSMWSVYGFQNAEGFMKVQKIPWEQWVVMTCILKDKELAKKSRESNSQIFINSFIDVWMNCMQPAMQHLGCNLVPNISIGAVSLTLEKKCWICIILVYGASPFCFLKNLWQHRQDMGEKLMLRHNTSKTTKRKGNVDCLEMTQLWRTPDCWSWERTRVCHAHSARRITTSCDGGHSGNTLEFLPQK